MKQRVLILAGFILICLNICAQVPALERIEPMFWWAGMKEPELQLIIHGKDIAARQVKLTYAGVKLVKVNKVENPNYLFVDLLVTPNARPGTFNIKFIKKGLPDLSYAYVLKKRSSQVNRAQGVTSKDLIYLLMPDRFSNGDPKNDVIPGMLETGLHRDSMFSRHGGDIQGMIDHLDYLKDLGVTAIWPTPEIENNEPVASYHGYAVTDHYKTDSRFGTNELYRQFVEKCHAAGLKVIKDLVHNHVGTEHYFIQDMPMKSWVHQWPAYTTSNYRDMAVMDPHASALDKKIMLNGWFDRRMADLNESNDYVQRYLIQNHIWWIEYAGVDGFRLDTYPYNDGAFMAKWAQAVTREFPRFSIYGETLVWSAVDQAFFLQGDKVGRGMDTHLPGVTDGVVKDAIVESLNGKEGWTDGVNRLYAVLTQDFLYQDPNRNVIFLDNHDMSRFLSVVNEDMAKYKSGMAMLLTMRGIPQLYYGDEILMKNFSAPDGLVREDFSGGWPADRVNKFTPAGRSEKENDAFNYVRKLANYRKATTALQSGKLMQFIPQKGVYVYFRYDKLKKIMVAYNSNDKEEKLSTAYYAEMIGNVKQASDVITGSHISLGNITIPAKTTLVLELLP